MRAGEEAVEERQHPSVSNGAARQARRCWWFVRCGAPCRLVPCAGTRPNATGPACGWLEVPVQYTVQEGNAKGEAGKAARRGVMAKLATVRLESAADGLISLEIRCAKNGGGDAPEQAAAAARAERLGRLDASKQAAGAAPSLRPASLRPGGPSLRPAGPLAPPSPKRSGTGAPDARGASSSVTKLGTYQYTKQQLIEHGKR